MRLETIQNELPNYLCNIDKFISSEQFNEKVDIVHQSTDFCFSHELERINEWLWRDLAVIRADDLSTMSSPAIGYPTANKED